MCLLLFCLWAKAFPQRWHFRFLSRPCFALQWRRRVLRLLKRSLQSRHSRRWDHRWWRSLATLSLNRRGHSGHFKIGMERTWVSGILPTIPVSGRECWGKKEMKESDVPSSWWLLCRDATTGCSATPSAMPEKAKVSSGKVSFVLKIKLLPIVTQLISFCQDHSCVTKRCSNFTPSCLVWSTNLCHCLYMPFCSFVLGHFIAFWFNF